MRGPPPSQLPMYQQNTEEGAEDSAASEAGGATRGSGWVPENLPT